MSKDDFRISNFTLKRGKYLITLSVIANVSLYPIAHYPKISQIFSQIRVRFACVGFSKTKTYFFHISVSLNKVLKVDIQSGSWRIAKSIRFCTPDVQNIRIHNIFFVVWMLLSAKWTWCQRISSKKLSSLFLSMSDFLWLLHQLLSGWQ